MTEEEEEEERLQVADFQGPFCCKVSQSSPVNELPRHEKRPSLFLRFAPHSGSYGCKV